ncbi:MAG: hypothetical protein ACRDYF_20005, partial [Acidimicrobiia bacterium]
MKTAALALVLVVTSACGSHVDRAVLEETSGSLASATRTDQSSLSATASPSSVYGGGTQAVSRSSDVGVAQPGAGAAAASAGTAGNTRPAAARLQAPGVPTGTPSPGERQAAGSTGGSNAPGHPGRPAPAAGPRSVILL